MTAILKVDTIQDTSGNNIISESSDTITIGASGDTIALAGTTITGITQGITMADQFRLTADIVGTNAVISSNLERVDDASFSKIGTEMSVSSGIFSFPSTGLYQILVKMSAYAPSVDNYYVETYATINNSSYDKIGRVGGSSDNSYENGQSESLFVNVTNTTNVKVKFQTDSLAGSSGVLGDTNYNRTTFTFIRLGDSQ